MEKRDRAIPQKIEQAFEVVLGSDVKFNIFLVAAPAYLQVLKKKRAAGFNGIIPDFGPEHKQLQILIEFCAGITSDRYFETVEIGFSKAKKIISGIEVWCQSDTPHLDDTSKDLIITEINKSIGSLVEKLERTTTKSASKIQSIMDKLSESIGNTRRIYEGYA
ncbi:hypothetical protein ABW19_dt0209942 [Dactylella cylindrospora]|nr:hypothetical protein ABW19_dt0209942 [Dactylella cylindrospora]